MNVSKFLAFLFCVALLANSLHAHDTWVQAGPLVTRHQDVVHVDLCLGNHGNNHRDFKLASKITLAPCTLEVIAPDGRSWISKSRSSTMGMQRKRASGPPK